MESESGQNSSSIKGFISLGRFFNRPTVSKGKRYDKFFIYVPTEVARDTTFPFRHGDRIEVEIKDNTLIIRKAKET